MLAQNRESGGNHESFMGCQPRTSSSCLISVVAVFIIFKLRFPGFSILLFIFLCFLKELLMPGRFQPWGNAVLLELEEFSKWHLFNRNKRKDVVSLTGIHHLWSLVASPLLTCHHEQHLPYISGSEWFQADIFQAPRLALNHVK